MIPDMAVDKGVWTLCCGIIIMTLPNMVAHLTWCSDPYHMHSITVMIDHLHIHPLNPVHTLTSTSMECEMSPVRSVYT